MVWCFLLSSILPNAAGGLVFQCGDVQVSVLDMAAEEFGGAERDRDLGYAICHVC